CAPVRVVLGARAAEAVALLPDPALAVVAEDWERGMSASLRAGLTALTGLTGPPAEAVLVHLVDLPDVGAPVVARLTVGVTATTVARATYGGRPGHPVVIGRAHWPSVLAVLRGDRGARDWLAGRPDLVTVECGDLAGGADEDTPDGSPA
ncbi:MAG TPA: NTP transferase domain-containing protein, partial [Pseudonocardiaceae bacterium]